MDKEESVGPRPDPCDTSQLTLVQSLWTLWTLEHGQTPNGSSNSNNLLKSIQKNLVVDGAALR